MAISLIANIMGKQIKQGVFMTGTINSDGSIGEVSYTDLKAIAAKKANATTLLVPKGQKIYVEGLNIIEVSNITEAMDLMLE